MAADPLNAYRGPGAMLSVFLGALVMFGGLWTHSDGLALLGILTMIIGGRSYEWASSPARADLRGHWNRFLDDYADSSCLLLNVVSVPFILWGFWTHRTVAILAGMVIAGAGHYYVHRTREEEAPRDGSTSEDLLP